MMTSLWICSEDPINLRLNQINVQVIEIKRDAVIKCKVKEVESKKKLDRVKSKCESD